MEECETVHSPATQGPVCGRRESRVPRGSTGSFRLSSPFWGLWGREKGRCVLVLS